MQRIREFNEDVLYKSTSSITLHFPLGIPPAVQYTEAVSSHVRVDTSA